MSVRLLEAHLTFLMTETQAGRFRKLVGTMSPPDDSAEAEIYVEVRFMVLIQRLRVQSHLNVLSGKEKDG